MSFISFHQVSLLPTDQQYDVAQMVVDLNARPGQVSVVMSVDIGLAGLAGQIKVVTEDIADLSQYNDCAAYFPTYVENAEPPPEISVHLATHLATVNPHNITVGVAGVAGDPGIVEYSEKTDAAFITGSDVWSDIVGLIVTITPETDQSMVEISGLVSFCYPFAGMILFRLTRDGSAIGVGDPAGDGHRCGASGRYNATTDEADKRNLSQALLACVDEPGTTSPVTYKIQVRMTVTSGAPATINVPIFFISDMPGGSLPQDEDALGVSTLRAHIPGSASVEQQLDFSKIVVSGGSVVTSGGEVVWQS